MSESHHDTSKKSKKKKNEKMRETVASLHREMEVAPKKRISRGESLKRTKRRKKLEKEERQEFLVQGDRNDDDETQHTSRRRRLRGSQAAYGDEVIHGSLIFPNPSQRASQIPNKFSKVRGDALDPIALEVDEDEDVGMEDDDDIPDFEDVQKQVEPEELDDDDDDDDDDEEDDEDDDDEDTANKKASDGIDKETKRKRNEKRRKQYRLRNFQSVRMAQRHGDALKFHAQGKPKLAIKALKQVARDVPSAPQVYSSLGMVYEDMLVESLKKSDSSEPLQQQSESAGYGEEEEEETEESKNSEMDPVFKDQLDLARKAYGSYHVAAILCKQDCTLWVKAAGCAIQAAELHGRATTVKTFSSELQEHHRSERKRWFFEALGDLKVADRLKPPGIEVPAKLAAVHMEVGKLSEALTILTDLKNRPASDGTSSEFQSSYKAWMLYADLMLRIGHECMQWNNNIRSNDNYMFRRWLRKLSYTFDWQERRLQALSLALEAAAGSKNIASFKQWVVQRSMGPKDNGDAASSPAPDAIPSNADQTEEQKEAEKKEQFEEEKRLLIAKNHTELEAFDKTTTDINQSGRTSATEQDRDSARDAMVVSHKEAVSALESEFNEANVDGNKIDLEDKVLGNESGSLPISASCRQVCEIACELMKHLLGLQLYEGARLAGEGVSAYFKERAGRCDKRIRKQRQYDEYQEKLARSPFMLQSYEEMYGSDSEEGDESSAYLSDDENLDNEESSELLASLRRGAFPPEMSVLFGLALIGAGGRNYVAARCIEKIEGMEQESIAWLHSGELESTIAGDPIFGLFQLAMTEPFGRTTAYSFVADFLRKTKKEDQWSNHFAPLFRRHLETLQSAGLLDAVTELPVKLSPYVNFRKNQLLKIMVASNRFDVGLVVSPEKGISFQRDEGDMSSAARIDLALSSMKSIRNFLHLVWKVVDGSLSPFCTDIVSLCHTCLSWLSNGDMGGLPYSKIHDVLEHATSILSQFCTEPIAEVKKPESTNDNHNEFDVQAHQWGDFPVKSSWQSSDCRAISLATYNLSVACNVSLFSGWELEEFNLKLLRRRHGNRHFGVHIHDKRITGYLRKETEDEILSQWKRLRDVFPSFPVLNFEERMAEVKTREWYRDEVEDRSETARNNPIARYGEDHGVGMFLAFSSLCLHLVKLETNPSVRNRLLKKVLSVLLPVSQFCVDDTLWESDIGEAAATVEGFDEWRLLTDLAPEQVHRRASGKHRKRKQEKIIEKKVQEWIKGTDKPVIRTYVKLPTRELRSVWNESDLQVALSDEDKELAKESMEKVHTAITQVRSCYSEMAIEKASLTASVALLDLASHRACYDPFACLQQAATFASAGLKLGSSDVHFRKALPDVKVCTPTEALMILGRADCLQALYFPNESAFLCSYVAKVCRLRRTSVLTWDDQWRILAILAFNVSVLIRTTVNTVLDKETKKSFLSMWERDVVEELEIARRDGWLWKRKYVSAKSDGKEELLNVDNEEELQDDSEEESDMDDEEQDSKIGSQGVDMHLSATGPHLPMETMTNIAAMQPFMAGADQMPTLDFRDPAFSQAPGENGDEEVSEILVVSV